MIELFKNDEDNILYGQDGNIFRTPYDFGKGFQNKRSLKNYIKISNVNISSLLHSVGMWWNQIDSMIGNKYVINFRSSTQSAYYLISYINNQTDAWPLIKFNNIARYQGSISFIGKIKNSFFVKNGATYCRHWRDGILTATEFTSINDANTEWFADNIYIGAYSDTIGGALEYNNVACKNNGFVLYDRLIPDAEIKYHVANLSGNELQSAVGLHVFLKLDFAEILDFSIAQYGSDMRVGCRDYSGNNRHGEIMNLPAGTLSEKLAWANANLFTSFIS